MDWTPPSAIRFLFDAPRGAPNRLTARWLFLRALGGIYFSAFFSLIFQIRGLIGPNGILPADNYLLAVAQSLGGWQRVWYAPTLLWWSSGPIALNALCWAGMLASLLLLLNIWPRGMLTICVVCFLSFVSAAQDFSSYQSDGMLLPYKTHLAAHFTHAAGGVVHSPGFYLHLAPGEVFVASGIWHPDARTALKIRNAIASQPKKWKAAIGSSDLKVKWSLGGEMLKRPPAGFAADHPMIEELKRKDFIASASFDEGDACSPRFIDRFCDICETTAPLMRFLTIALDLPW